ncbi:MAG: AAA family ATPase, partial [Chitinophagaceae bacterium]
DLYRISTQVQSDSRFITYRAIRETDESNVLLKIPKSSYPSAQVLKNLQQEYKILFNTNHPNIIRAQRIESYENSLALVLDDISGLSLTEIIKNETLSTEAFFSIAIPLTDAVKSLHFHHLIHKNINPSNIYIRQENGQPILMGFSIASEISREGLQPNSRELPDTELAYISPEQTGRMNRPLDYRTDLYSLGIVFYALLTGKPAFTSPDPMEMIHSHIAKQPKSPHEVKPEIPEIISNIVTRLLSKSTDDRYQSAAGLLFDLQKCADLFKSNSAVEDFKLGERDIHDQFRIPDKLYGRTSELEKLLQSYKHASNGQAELVLVSGYSGVGKSRLVSEIKKTISQSNGYFISGKFDQFKRDVPLSPLLLAFRELILQILTESNEQISLWKTKLTSALGPNGKIITDVIPEVELLIGPQQTVPELPAMEANNRFNSTLNRFVNVFAKREHPLCIFLDDLQWIDSATRQWIETKLTQEELDYFLLIGGYRDNEINSAHPLMMMLNRLQQKGVANHEINLQPFDRATLNNMVAEVLVTNPENCTDLSELVYKKTNGNPFFTRQCLLALFESSAIYFDPELHCWQYNLGKALNAEISDNVLDLMYEQIKKLPQPVQYQLKVASCIGNQFNVQLLTQVSEQHLDTTNDQLSLAVQKGLLIPLYALNQSDTEEFKFLHDRVQQAAYSLLEDAEKKLIRLKAGRILLADTPISESEEKIYDIADHLNYSDTLISDPAEIQKIAEVNLAASIRAKNATAYEPALKYILKAMNHWHVSGNHAAIVSRELLLQRAECEHLNGNNDIAEDFYDQAINQADGILNKARIYQRKIYYYNNLRKFNEAYETGRKAVKPLGVDLPAKFFPPGLLKELIVYRFLRGNKKIPDIVNIREMTDENLRMAILLMATFGRAAYQIKPELCIAVCARMVNICLKHGNTDGGFIGYLAFGPIFLGAILNRKQSGFDLGQLTLDLVEKYKSHFYKAETHFVVGYFSVPWKRSALEMEKYWQIAYESGLEVGDFFHTSCSCCATIQSYYMRGVSFDEIMSTSDKYLEFLKGIKNEEAILTIRSVRQSILNLRGETESAISYNSADFIESDYKTALEDFSSRNFAHYYYINKMQTLYLWGEYQLAYDCSLISDNYLKDSPGMLHTAEHFFFKALIICALYKESSGIQRFKWKITLHKIKNQFRNYSQGSPSNFIHKYQLLEAELSRAEGNFDKAQNYYYAAIESAAKYGYTNVHGLANTITAKFHYDNGRRRLAGFHVQDAVYDYKNQGAGAYAESLLLRYPGLSEKDDSGFSAMGNDPSLKGLSASNKKTGNIDLATILKSSEAISRKIHLDDLLTSMLKIIIENAGAERIVLLLSRDQQLRVQAEYIIGNEEVMILPEIPMEQYEGLSKAVVNYVSRSLSPVILDDALVQGKFTNDIYFLERGTRSVLCAPLVLQGKLTGIIYLENNLTNAAFTQERIDLLLVLSGQIAIS